MLLEYFTDAFIEQFPIFMIVITISGLASIIQIVKITLRKEARKDKGFILETGLFALFVGLLVFPIETFQMLEAMKVAGEYGPSVVMGGFYLTFVPMLYGLLWFLISLAGWLHYKRKAT